MNAREPGPRRARFILYVESEPDSTPQEIILTEPATVIGSAPPSDLILQAAGLSPTHARIELGRKECRVRDLGSGQGIWINNRRAQVARLKPGDVIRLGKVTLRYEPQTDSPTPTKTVVAPLPPATGQKSEILTDQARPAAQIGRYRIEEMLGVRGHYTVYRARDPELDRVVAIKLMSDSVAQDDLRARVLGEVKLIATLDHPCVVQVYDYGEYQGRPFVVMPLMVGGTLMAALAQEGPFSAQRLLPVITRIADALDEAHARGILHLQLKPRNILFDEHEQAYLSDFAIPSLDILRPDQLDPELMPYLSPEQAMSLVGGKAVPLSGQSDIYALGAILFEALTGRPPFQAATALETALARLDAPIPQLAAVRPELAAFQEVIDRAMSVDCPNRYARAGDMARHLQDLLGGRGFLQRLTGITAHRLPTLRPGTPPSGATETIAEIGRYRVERELGRGGMATVYLAFDPLIDRHVAIKLLPGRLLNQAGWSELFHREAQIVARLRHENIVSVYDVGEHAGQPFIVMQYLPGGTLAQQLAEGPMRLRRLSLIIEQVAAALDYAHSMQVIHRDVKPANILFNADQQAFLSDFGIAVIAEAAAKTSGGQFAAGTPEYLSPEQARSILEQSEPGWRRWWVRWQGKKRVSTGVDTRSDIYSLGVVIFDALAGHPPYQAETPHQIALMHLNAPIPRLDEQNPELPKHCQAIIERAMAKDPDQRYQTARELAADLSELVTGRWILRRLADQEGE